MYKVYGIIIFFNYLLNGINLKVDIPIYSYLSNVKTPKNIAIPMYGHFCQSQGLIVLCLW
jgi:hypothetical protein